MSKLLWLAWAALALITPRSRCREDLLRCSVLKGMRIITGYDMTSCYIGVVIFWSLKRLCQIEVVVSLRLRNLEGHGAELLQ